LALVLALIARDDGSELWVRVETLAQYLGVKRLAVSRQIAALRALGVLITVRRASHNRSTVRRLNVDAL
jgi:biotin operon repressor